MSITRGSDYGMINDITVSVSVTGSENDIENFNIGTTSNNSKSFSHTGNKTSISGTIYNERSDLFVTVHSIAGSVSLLNYNFSGNGDVEISIKFTFKRIVKSYAAPEFKMQFVFEDYSFDKNKMRLAETDSEVLNALEKQFLSATDLFKNREKWRNDS